MGFLFLVLYPLLVLPHHPPTHTHSLARSLARSRARSLTHSLTHSLTVSLTHSLTHSITHSLTHPLTHSFTYVQGVGCTLWRPFVSAALPVAFAWQVRRLVLCKRSDVSPGVPWSLPVCRWLLRGRCGTWCSARGRIYALASLGLRRSAMTTTQSHITRKSYHLPHTYTYV